METKPRKSSTALAAREKARARAQEMTRRHEELIELAAEFFVQDDRVTDIDQETEKKITELLALAEQKKESAKALAADVVQRMNATGESKKSIAERLGLSAADLKRFIPTAPKDDDAPRSDAADQAE